MPQNANLESGPVLNVDTLPSGSNGNGLVDLWDVEAHCELRLAVGSRARLDEDGDWGRHVNLDASLVLSVNVVEQAVEGILGRLAVVNVHGMPIGHDPLHGGELADLIAIALCGLFVVRNRLSASNMKRSTFQNCVGSSLEFLLGVGKGHEKKCNSKEHLHFAFVLVIELSTYLMHRFKYFLFAYFCTLSYPRQKVMNSLCNSTRFVRQRSSHDKKSIILCCKIILISLILFFYYSIYTFFIRYVGMRRYQS